MFLADKSWNCGEYAFDPSHTLRQFAQSQVRLSRQQLDVVGIHSMTSVGMVLPVLRKLQAEGKIRYVGLTSHEMYQYAGMEPAITAGTIDFIQVRYSIFQRLAEDRLLPLAADHGVAVMVNMALEKARLTTSSPVIGCPGSPGSSASATGPNTSSSTSSRIPRCPA